MKRFKQSRVGRMLIFLRQIVRKVRGGALGSYANTSFAQEGEDLVVLRHLGDIKTGFYVEVGALAPKRFSNTWLFYMMGWRGILIEPNPTASASFKRTRPQDIFVNEGVSSEEQSLCYYRFREPALNTFDPAVAEQRQKDGWGLIDTTTVRTRSLSSILEEHMPEGVRIRLMSIDVEGFDEIVVKSNDWSRYSPEWLIVELLDVPLAEVSTHSIARYLADQGYRPVAKTGHSVIFQFGPVIR